MHNQDQAPVRVIVADDHGPFRDALCALIAATVGFEIIGAAAGAMEALDLLACTEPDLVLLDLQMPGLGSVEMAHRFRRRNPDVVIVLLTVNVPRYGHTGSFAIEDKHHVSPRWLVDLWRDRSRNRDA